MFQHGLNGLLIKLNRNASLLLMKRTKEGYVNDASFCSQFSVTMIVKATTPVYFHEAWHFSRRKALEGVRVHNWELHVYFFWISNQSAFKLQKHRKTEYTPKHKK